MSSIAAMPDEEWLATITLARGRVHGGKTPPEMPIHVVTALTMRV